MQSRFRRGAGSVSVCLVCVSCLSVCLSSVALDRNRKLVVKWQGALRGSWQAGGASSRASSGRHVRKWDVRLFSSNEGRAGSPPVGLAGGGQAGGLLLGCAVLHTQGGPMCPKQTRTKREKKQRGGREAKKDRIKSKTRGTTTLPCSLGENRLQRSRFRLARTIICTHEQTAKPTIHALADPSCRHVLCVSPICPHIDFSCLECHFCPRRFALLSSAVNMACLLSLRCCFLQILSDPICPKRVSWAKSTDHRLPRPLRRFDTWPMTRSRERTCYGEHWSTGSHNARCQNGPPRLIPLPQSPNLDSDPVSLSSAPLCLAPLQHGPSRRTCLPKQPVSHSLSRSSPRHSNIQRGAARHPFGASPPPSNSPLRGSSDGEAYHFAYHQSSPAQHPSPHRCLLACMPPTDRKRPKTNGPQPVTSVC